MKPKRTPLKMFKVEAQGDTLYLQAETKDQARAKLFENMMGPIPDKLLKWTEVKELPKGEEFL